MASSITSNRRSASSPWVVFDLGGVVVRYSHETVQQAVAQLLGKDLAVVHPVWARIWDELGDGTLSVRESAELLQEVADAPIDPDDLARALCSGLEGEYAEMVELIHELRVDAKIACLSNTIDPHWRRLAEGFPAMQLFEVPMASHELGARKPGIEIFDRAAAFLAQRDGSLRNWSAPPLLIDDLIENVEGAKAAGWQAIHYQGNIASLRLTLTQLGHLK